MFYAVVNVNLGLQKEVWSPCEKNAMFRIYFIKGYLTEKLFFGFTPIHLLGSKPYPKRCTFILNLHLTFPAHFDTHLFY